MIAVVVCTKRAADQGNMRCMLVMYDYFVLALDAHSSSVELMTQRKHRLRRTRMDE